MRPYVVHLTGGLGNQLFQISTALSFADLPTILIEEKLGRPRLNSKSQADLQDFEMNREEFKTTARRLLPNLFMSRVSNFALRVGVIPTKFEKRRIIRSGIDISASLLLSLNFFRPLRVLVGQGLGYFHLHKGRFLASYQVGYFQSFRWAQQPEIFSQLMTLSPKNPAGETKKWIEKIALESPIVVHIRLGDYKSESGFGIPSQSYYRRSLEQIREFKSHASIWYFSDEPELAKKYLGDECPEGFWFDFDPGSSAHLMEIMRFGSGYVIGNSSFSWWAAFLRKDRTAKVIAPTPWFRDNSPIDLIPPDWILIDSGITTRKGS